jgi:hypothetical protein
VAVNEDYGGGQWPCSIASTWREPKLWATTGKTVQQKIYELESNFYFILRTAAEWLLRNGACARFVNSPVLFCDYNVLPPENTKFFVKEIEATNAGINAEGFVHLKGCEKLDRIFLNDCVRTSELKLP